jgi:hypothetical protein
MQQQAQFINQTFKAKQRPKFKGSVQNAIDSGDKRFFSHQFDDPHFANFVSQAYAAPSGVSFRTNPDTGEREMMIAGTRHHMQWALNAADSILYGADKLIKNESNFLSAQLKKDSLGFIDLGHKDTYKFFAKLDRPRVHKEKLYSRLARTQHVDVVYGHSRGGAMAADLDFEGTKVGVDAAMLIANNTDVTNFNEGGGMNPLGLFDELIGATGKKNVHIDQSFWSPHKVWKT